MILKPVFIIAIVVVAMIGMIFQSAFAYTISDDTTGGDCSIIGTWDSTIIFLCNNSIFSINYVNI